MYKNIILDNNLSDEGFIIFITKLTTNTKQKIKELYLYNTNITSESITPLSLQINSHYFCSLKELDLGGNKLSLAGFKELFDSIIYDNIFLRTLYLSSIYKII